MRIYILLVFCVLFWSGNFVLGRYIKDDLAPLQLSLFRWLGVLIIFFPFIVQKRAEVIKNLIKHPFLMVVLSFLGVVVFNTVLYVGLQDTTATNALLINSSTPILIIIFSMIILKTKISSLQVLGILLSMAGVIYLALNGDFGKLITLEFNKGDIWIIFSSISWAIYSILLKFKPKDFELFFPTTVLLGTLILFVLFCIQGHQLSDILHVSMKAKLVIAYTIVFPSILSFYLWHEGIAEIGAEKTGQFTHLMPVFGIILTYLFLGEQLRFYQIVGFVFVGIGLYLSLVLAKQKG